MTKPSRNTLLLAAALLAAFALALFLWAKAPPSAARLLPECDAIVYANLQPFRAAAHFDRSPVARSPDFQRFIDATGIVPERDFTAAAFALHHMDDPRGPNGPVAYSEVFRGHFDGPQLARYLAGIASSQESYAGRTIFVIPVGDTSGPTGRKLRVTLLDGDTVAASNAPTPEQIHAMLDRRRSAGLPFAGPTLLTERFSDVPVLSSVWAIGRVGLPFAEGGYVTLFGLRLPIPADSSFIASARYLGSLHLRVEEIASSEATASQTVQDLSTILVLFRDLQKSQLRDSSAGGAALGQALESLKIDRQADRVVLTANLPLELLRQLAAPAPQAPLGSPAASHQ